MYNEGSMWRIKETIQYNTKRQGQIQGGVIDQLLTPQALRVGYGKYYKIWRRYVTEKTI